MRLANNPYREFHPFSPFVPPCAERVIIGSFPPVKLTRRIMGESSDPLLSLYNDYLTRHPRTERDLDFYYGSADNLFWKLFGDLYERKLDNLLQIKDLLINTKTAVTDVIEITIRKLYCKKRNRTFLPTDIISDQNTQDVSDHISSERSYQDYSISSGDNCLYPLLYRDIYTILHDRREIRQLVFTGRYAWQLFWKVYSEFSYADRNKRLLTLDGKRFFEIIILPSPSGSANKSIGGLREFKEKRELCPKYNTYQYRLDIYRKLLLS